MLLISRWLSSWPACLPELQDVYLVRATKFDWPASQPGRQPLESLVAAVAHLPGALFANTFGCCMRLVVAVNLACLSSRGCNICCSSGPKINLADWQPERRQLSVCVFGSTLALMWTSNRGSHDNNNKWRPPPSPQQSTTNPRAETN